MKYFFVFPLLLLFRVVVSSSSSSLDDANSDADDLSDMTTLEWVQAASTPRDWPLRKPAMSEADMRDLLGEPSALEMAHFEREYLDPLLHERVPGTQGHRDAQEFLRSKFDALGWSVFEDRFTADTPMGAIEFTNFVVTKNPRAKRKIVLSAHYDSKYFSDFAFVGATDSAAPCALLLLLAEKLNGFLDNAPSDTTLQLVFFDGEEAFVEWTEEDSLYGARHLASLYQKRKSEMGQIELLVLLDLLATESATILNYFPSTSSLYQVLQRIELRLRVKQLTYLERLKPRVFPNHVVQHRLGMSMQDDHVPFLHRGVPVLYLMPSQFPRVWHTKGDDKSALHLPTLLDIGRTLTVFVAEFLNS